MMHSKQTGEGLENVRIYTGGDNSKYITTTDADGNFKFEVKKEFNGTYVAKRIGYSETTFDVEPSDKVIMIYMNESNSVTDEIKVNSSLKDEDNMSGNFYMTSNLNSVDELLSKLPGVNLVRRGNFAAEPVIRGLNTDRMNVTIDGMKVHSACTDKMDPITSYAESGNLKSIDVFKGSFDPNLNDNNFTGLDLKLNEAKIGMPLLSGMLKGGYLTSGKGKNLEGRFNYSSKIFGSVFNVVYKSSDDYKTGNDSIIPYSGYNKVNISNSTMLKTGSDSYMLLSAIYDHAWDIGYPALTMDVKKAEALITGLEYRVKNVSKLVTEMRGKVYYNSVDHVMDDSKRDNLIKMDMPGNTKTLGAYVTSDLMLGSSTLLNAKADFVFSNSLAEMTMYSPTTSIPMYMQTWPDVDKYEYGLGVVMNKSVFSNSVLMIKASGGYAKSSVNSDIGMGELKIFYPQFTGKDSRFYGLISAGLNIPVTATMTAGLSYTYNQRSLTVSEQYAFYIFNRQDNYDYIGDPFIKNEAVSQTELNFNFKFKDFHLDNSVFGYYYDKYIIGIVNPAYSPMTEGATGVKVYQNIPSAYMLGFEQTANVRLSSSFQLINNIQYVAGKQNEGKYLPQMPPLSGTFSARYQKGIFLVQGETVWAAAQNNIDPSYGETRTPSYAVFNLRSSAEVNKYLFIDAGVENIFNREYYEHLDWQKLPRPGINFYVSAKIVM